MDGRTTLRLWQTASFVLAGLVIGLAIWIVRGIPVPADSGREITRQSAHADNLQSIYGNETAAIQLKPVSISAQHNPQAQAAMRYENQTIMVRLVTTSP